MMTEGDQVEEPHRDVWEIFRSIQYGNLKEMLINAAEDCDKRGHTRAISARFRDAAAVCDTAGNTP